MEKYEWSKLNKLQVGAFAEYFVKMELTMHGLRVYSPEVDDHGIDFVTRTTDGRYLEFQVKSIRGNTRYVFMLKRKFNISPRSYLAFVLFLESEAPHLYIIPSTVWEQPSAVFVSRDYKESQSESEWGFNVAKKHMPNLEKYRFTSMVEELLGVSQEH